MGVVAEAARKPRNRWQNVVEIMSDWLKKATHQEELKAMAKMFV